ncbi:MAG: Holliday junction resolvase RuvX [Actinomycetota bacterium]
MRVLGIDLGSVRIGLALSDAGGVLATPHSVIRRSKRRELDHEAIKAVVEEWEVERIVVGLPLSLDGSVGKAAKAALREADELGVVTGVPVETYDERLTTVSAHQVLREQGVAGADRKDVVDKVAAAVLLQAWLDGRDTETNP